MSRDPLDQLAGLFERTHETLYRHAARSVDAALVARNWLFGWYIEEFERGGASRTEVYGKGVMKDLAERLKARSLRGCSVESLNCFRRFYREHPEIRSTLLTESSGIESTPSTQSSSLTLTSIQLASLLNAFPLGWSHYLELMLLDDADERRFYEIEAVQNQWAVRELRRQIDSSLYERLALSRDKAEIRRLATDGQVVERAADLVKNPLVLEFLGLDERPQYTEEDLESAVIDKLQAFLLELGNGFRSARQAGGRAAHRWHRALPRSQRRPRGADAAGGREHLLFEVPTLPSLEGRAEGAPGGDHAQPRWLGGGDAEASESSYGERRRARGEEGEEAMTTMELRGLEAEIAKNLSGLEAML